MNYQWHDVAPHSAEWLQMRAGIPTASEFKRILTPTGKASTQAVGYLHTLLAEWWTGAPLDSPETEWMTRGIELEDECVARYELHSDLETSPGGFFTILDGRIGCTPDRLVSDVGILEMKCPKPNTQISYLLEPCIEQDYRPQLQGQLWVTGRKWVDIVAYHPLMPLVVMRVERDEKYIALLSAAVTTFADQLLTAKLLLIERYGQPVRPTPPAEQSYTAYELSEADEEAIVASMRFSES